MKPHTRHGIVLSAILTLTSVCSSPAAWASDTKQSPAGVSKPDQARECVLILPTSTTDTPGTTGTAGTVQTQRTDGIAPDQLHWSNSHCGSCDHGARLLNYCDDREQLVPDFFANLDAVLTRKNLLCLFAVGGLSYAVHETLDDDVADNVTRHANRWGKGQEFFAAIGNPGHHFAAIATVYGYSLYYQDAEAHDLSKTMFHAVAITGLSTVMLKATIGTNTTAPNDEPDPFGGAWPSGHTSSSFAVAAVLDEYYGHKIGVPAYLLAGLVGWERLDDGEHDLSDVIFGAALGYVIGKTVASRHLSEWCGMEVLPLTDPESGALGISLERRF